MSTTTQLEQNQHEIAYSYQAETPGIETPTPVHTPHHSDAERLLYGPPHRLGEELERRLTPIPAENSRNHLGRPASATQYEDIELQPHPGWPVDISRLPTPHLRPPASEGHGLVRTISNKLVPDPHVLQRDLSNLPNVTPGTLETGREPGEQSQGPSSPTAQGLPSELPNFFAEIVFIMVCSTGQLFFSILQGNILVNQVSILPVLGLTSTQAPWLVGAFLLANGLSVVISGSLADLAGPKSMMVAAFAWLTLWNIIGVFSLEPSRQVLFFIVRAMQGLSVGVLVSASMSALGRIYKPGVRKTRVFSSMAAMAPFGYWLGCLQGGALSSNLPWIFGSTAVLSGLACVAGVLTVPSLHAAKDSHNVEAPSIKDFDYFGATIALAGCGSILFGLTQGSPTGWSPYTYSLVVVGMLCLAAFPFIEHRVHRPLIPNRLWATPGFAPLIISYFLSFGAYVGGWAFFTVRFWLKIQHVSPLTVALYITPNAIFGVVATWIVSKTLHRVAGHWILVTSMLAYALGPVFMLPQTASTPYWALSMPGVAIVTFGPDLSFAAASIFITSAVPRSYQGSAGSLLVTIQNLSAAIITAVADSIGAKVTKMEDGELDLEALRAIWWFSLGLCIVAGVLCTVKVRMPKSEEKEHAA